MPTYRLDLAYDGSGYHGYARQPGLRTVQGNLEEALFRVTGPVETSVAGRTDAGVHAYGQVVTFQSESRHDPQRLGRSLNRMLNPETAVWSVTEAEGGFDARFSAVSRTYRYLVLNRPVVDPFLRGTTWHVTDRLDVAAMNEAASAFPGTRDFAALCRAAAGRSTVREVLAASWSWVLEDLVRFEVTATSFCHQMVRSMVALCVEVGRGRTPAGRVPGLLASLDRSHTPGAAPPHGLTLWEVGYS